MKNTIIATANGNNKSRKKKAAGGCYQCGSDLHRAKECPDAVCKICGEAGHNFGSCPQKPLPPVDLGSFQAIADKNNNNNNNNNNDDDNGGGFTYIELFAGLGGFRVALDKLGGKCVLASEVDRFCTKNYQVNFGDRPAGDVCRIESEHIPNHDLLVGGFPCQPFSSSGSRLGVEDPSGRGVLFREIVRILKHKRPRTFLLENVRGLLLHDGGKTLELIVRELEGCGYSVSYELVNAVNLVPQERCRLFFVGILMDDNRKQRDDDDDDDSSFVFPTLGKLNSNRGVEDIIQLQMDPCEMEELLLSPNQLKKVRAQRYTKEHPEARFLSNRKLPAKTIQSSYTKYMVGSQFISASESSGGGCVDGDDQWRRFSRREVARLQGFPESFVLCKDRAHHMLGNAVCPPVIALIAAELLQYAQLCPDRPETDWGWDIAKSMLIEGSPNDTRRRDLVEKLSGLSTVARKKKRKTRTRAKPIGALLPLALSNIIFLFHAMVPLLVCMGIGCYYLPTTNYCHGTAFANSAGVYAINSETECKYDDASFQIVVEAWNGTLVDHIPYEELTYQEFITNYQSKHKPVVIKGMYANSPLTKGMDEERWEWKAIRDGFGDVLLENRVEGTAVESGEASASYLYPSPSSYSYSSFNRRGF